MTEAAQPGLRMVRAIAEDQTMISREKAIECIRSLSTVSERARQDFRAAAQTFALLAIEEALTSSASGTSPMSS